MCVLVFDVVSMFFFFGWNYLNCDIILQQSEKIATVVKAAGVSVESYWPSLFAKLAEKRSIDDLILNAGSGGAAAPVAVSAAAGGAVAAAAPAVEEKKV